MRRRLGPLLTPVFQTVWRLNRAMTLGVRGLIEDASGRVCLVRHSYTPGWHLPGGGVERGEDAATALAREIAEEAGVEALAPPRLVSVHRNPRFAGDHVLVFAVSEWRACPPAADGEITDIAWVDPAAPPEATTPATRARLAEHRGERPVSADW